MREIKITSSRADLAALFFKGIGVEIGVERGVFSKEICMKNPDTNLYCVDPWKAYKGYRDHVSQEKLDGFYCETVERLKHFRAIVLRASSVDAAKQFRDGELDFVFIDANHDYEHVTEDLNAWVAKVRSGGIVSGHDYIRRKGQDHLYAVVQAVRDYADKNGIKEVTIWCGDRSPSWSFIKP